MQLNKCKIENDSENSKLNIGKTNTTSNNTTFIDGVNVCHQNTYEF
jgi:hypothetical protein